MERPRCSGDSAINYLTKIRNKTMKVDIHKHNANAEYKSEQSNLTVDTNTGEIKHESLDSMSDERFDKLIDECKLVKIWSKDTADDRANVKTVILGMQSNYRFSSDVTEKELKDGSLLTTIYKVARPDDTSSALARFGAIIDR